ncbi:MAG: hypothetical protein U5L06_00700 [Rhodovibrio sp.]|nr:hypothetical protein [Rhodovibrio sp.]
MNRLTKTLDALAYGLLAAVVIAAAVTAMPPAALAQDGGEISFGPLLAEYLVPIVATVLSVVVGWAIKQGADLIGINKSSQLVANLQGIVQQGVDYAEKRAKGIATNSSIAAIEIENKKVADATNYVVSQAPKWLRQAGVTEDQVRQWVRTLVDTPETDRQTAGK